MGGRSESSLEALSHLLLQQPAHLLSPPSPHTASSSIGGLPVHLSNPLFPSLMQQQLLNYSFMQLISSMMARSSLSALDPQSVQSPLPTTETDPPGSSLLNDSHRELVVPNDDKEGWCRNKKYIEKVASGFMCLVCRKVYGRYNSVSYHVTIYHRNPPIKCDVEGCDFSTREARYIHFHKHYRHGIGLPRSIDQGSRRCVFCKHISKSPAMLEKHMKRHAENGATIPWTLSKEKKDDAFEPIPEEPMEDGRGRTMSECVPMDMDDMDCKPRSFTL